MAAPKKIDCVTLEYAMDPWERIEALEEELREKNAALDRLKIAQSILDNSEDFIFAVDRNLRFLYANPMTISYGARALKCPEHVFLQKSLIDIAAADLMMGSDIYKRKFFAIGRLFDHPKFLYVESSINFDKNRLWLGVWWLPVFNEHGLVTSVAAVARNITDQIKAQTAFAEEKERLAVILSSIGDAAVATDATGRISTMNKIAEHLMGARARESIGRPIEELFHAVDEKTRADVPNPVREVLAQTDLHTPCREMSDRILIATGGRETLIAGVCAPIRRNNRDTIGAVLVFRDVSRQKAVEEDMHRVQKLEAVGLLAGGIAHDFNNILTSVMGNLSLVQRWARGNEIITDRLADAEKAVVQAQSLTNQLLTFSKGGAPIKTLASVQAIIKESAAFSLIGSAVQRVFRIPDDLWRVEVDEGQIAQVIQNLVINADQAMPGGGKVVISAENCFLEHEDGVPLAPGQYVKIAVADQGVGIPDDIQDRVFDPYFTTKKNGTGLGLATTHSIIRRHGGHITVDSKENEGTTFSIYLPATEERISSDFIHEYLPDLKRGRMLVMDDEETIRDVATAILLELGFEVETTVAGRETLALYDKRLKEGRRFDAVIMDLTIPGGLGGKETLSLLKQIDPDAKAIVSSGYSMDPVMSEYKIFGFDGRMTKPYGVDQMAKVLRKVLSAKP